MNDKKRGLNRYLLLITVALIIVASFLIVKPFLSAIFAGIVLAYVFYPLFRYLNKYITNKTLCSLLICIFIVLIILLPMFFVANALIKESFSLYNQAKGNGIDFELPGLIDDEAVEDYVKELISRGSLLIIDSVSNFVFSIPARILDFFIIIFIMFYLFKDGHSVIKKFKDILPFDRKTAGMMSKEFADITFAVVYGLVVTAIAQGIIGGLGFYFFGIANPILWGTVMALIAIIPFLGPFLVWLPIGIFELAYGNRFAGIGILVYGIFVISTIDNIIRPKIIGDRANVHPAIVLIGVLGGIKLFGFIGVVVGPLMLALMLAMLEKYRVRHIESKS